MKIVTFHRKDLAEAGPEFYRIGRVEADGRIADLTEAISDTVLSAEDLLECFDLESDFSETLNAADGFELLDRSEISLCPPVPRPGKIICIGLNYRDHAAESGMAIPTAPIIFSKFSSCAIGSDTPIRIPSGSSQVDYEAELAVVIGRRARGVKADNAMDHVLGYTNFNDVSARDFQFADGQWQRGKSCDTFAPMGEFIATRDEIPDPHDLRIRFRLNGETLQDSSTSQLIFRIPELIEFISAVITLEPGDVIATGTPPGVGFARKPPIFMKAGDTAEVEIDGLGVLKNKVEE